MAGSWETVSTISEADSTDTVKPRQVSPDTPPFKYRKICFVIQETKPLPKALREGLKELKNEDLNKLAFVTTGATASFDSLVRAVLNPTFLNDLKSSGYTNLVLQHGPDYSNIVKEFNSAYPPGSNARDGILITTFDFNHGGLHKELLAAKGYANDAIEGVVISHAGTGSILECLRVGIPLIVVPNPTLLDDHQRELAEALDAAGLVVHSDVLELDRAILKIENRRGKKQPWPPLNETSHDGQVGRLMRALSDMGIMPTEGVLVEEEYLIKIAADNGKGKEGILIEGLPQYPY